MASPKHCIKKGDSVSAKGKVISVTKGEGKWELKDVKDPPLPQLPWGLAACTVLQEACLILNLHRWQDFNGLPLGVRHCLWQSLHRGIRTADVAIKERWDAVKSQKSDKQKNLAWALVLLV